MGTTSEKLQYLGVTKGKIKDSINLTGAGITNSTTFRNYATVLKDTLANGIGDIDTFRDTLIDNFPKVTGTGTSISFNAYSSWLDYVLNGDTEQYTTTLGKNLFDCKTTAFSNTNVNISFSGNTITMTTNTTTNSGNLFFMTKIPDEYLTNGQSYTISSTNVSGVLQSLKLQLRNKNGTYVSGKNRLDTVVYDSAYSLYVDGNIYSTDNSQTIQSGTTAVISNIQVEKGSSQTSYESFVPNSPSPLYPQEVQTATGRQEVEVCGKNRFNIDKVPTSTINITGTNQEFTISQLGSNTNTQLDIIFESSKRYAISGAYSSTKANGSLRITYTDNTTENVFGVFDNSTILKTNFSFVNNLKSIKSAEFRLFGGGNYTIYDLQIEEIPNTSTTPTSYEPYIGQSYEINLGKQLFNFDDTHYFRFDNSSTLSKTNNVITFANSLDNNRGFVWWNIPVEIGKQLSISYSSITEQTEHSANGVCYLESDTPITSYVSDINESTQLDKTSKKATITTTKKYLTLILRVRNINSISISDLIVNYGTPTTYAEYFTPIELCKIGTYQDKIFKGKGVNLFDGELESGSIDANGNNISSTDRVRSKNYIEVKPNTTYYLNSNFGNLAVNGAVYSRCYDNSKNYVNALQITPNGSFTIPNGVYYFRVQYIVGNGNQQTAIDNHEIMLNEGNQAQLYEPYNAKDKWLLHKEIGKVIIDGTGTWTTQTPTGFYRYGTSISSLNNSSSLASTLIIKTNYYKGIVFDNRNTDTIETIYPTNNNSDHNIFFNTMVATNINDFKTWLSTHNTSVYYVLANPTTTEITGDLKDQLETVSLVDGLNNITITGDLPSPLDIKGLEKE